MFKYVKKQWDSYKYRFLPWIALNLKHRKIRCVDSVLSDKIISDELLREQICTIFESLAKRVWTSPRANFKEQRIVYENALNVMNEVMGFSVVRSTSPLGGDGVFVRRSIDAVVTENVNMYRCNNLIPKDLKYQRTGTSAEGGACSYCSPFEGLKDENKIKKASIRKKDVVLDRNKPHGCIGRVEPCVKKGYLVALYPGLLYLPFEPILIQSIKNPFLFRCIDGVLVDGNSRGLSKALYRSVTWRDGSHLCPSADQTWLTAFPSNPLNVGQYVNNQGKGRPSNVAYQEINLPEGIFGQQERSFLANHWNTKTALGDGSLRLVALVATRSIYEGEELLSDYFTLVK